MMTKRERVRAQVKSRWYYSFWGIATIAVVSGQIYVGTSYRAMARSMNRWFDTAVEALIDNYPTPRPRGHMNLSFLLQKETFVTILLVSYS